MSQKRESPSLLKFVKLPSSSQSDLRWWRRSPLPDGEGRLLFHKGVFSLGKTEILETLRALQRQEQRAHRRIVGEHRQDH